MTAAPEVIKVMHLLDHSLPLHSGYAFRTESILRAQQNHGIEVSSLTSPKQGPVESWIHEEEGLIFHRSNLSGIPGNSPLDQLSNVKQLRSKLKQLVREQRPDIIHAHSPCLNGLAALGLGIPVVYEVRATWEDAAVASGTTEVGSLRYRLTRGLESFVMRQVQHGVVICDGLREDFLTRGFDSSHLTVVGNAINPDTYVQPAAEDISQLRAHLSLEGKTVLGFFGSFYKYEGLPLLLDALASLREQFPELHLLLAGGGEDEEHIVSRANGDLADSVTFVGRVPHDEIATYYGVSDIVVFPRLKERLTDIVTPLKPLEGMFFNSIVIASDCGGHKELVQDGQTGALFTAGNVQALAARIAEVVEQREQWPRWHEQAINWLLNERTWDAMAQKYRSLYLNLLASGDG